MKHIALMLRNNYEILNTFLRRNGFQDDLVLDTKPNITSHFMEGGGEALEILLWKSHGRTPTFLTYNFVIYRHHKTGSFSAEPPFLTSVCEDDIFLIFRAYSGIKIYSACVYCFQCSTNV